MLTSEQIKDLLSRVESAVIVENGEPQYVVLRYGTFDALCRYQREGAGFAATHEAANVESEQPAAREIEDINAEIRAIAASGVFGATGVSINANESPVIDTELRFYREPL